MREAAAVVSSDRAIRLRAMVAGLAVALGSCISAAPNRQEPLDGGAPYSCGLLDQPCCPGARCDDGSQCVAHAVRRVELPAFEDA